MEPWTELRTATVLAKVKTVSAAAAFLGVHRATVIRHIDVLEDFLGSRLFLRHAKGYTLTEAGQDLRDVGMRMAAQFSDLAGRLKGSAELVSGELVITAVGALASLLMPSIAQYRAAFPSSQVRFLASPELVDLGYGDAHVAIRGGSKPTNPDYVVLPFVTLRLGLYASSRFTHAFRESIEAQNWNAIPYASVLNSPSGIVAEAWMAQNAPTAPHSFTSNDPNTNLRAILSGIGAGWALEHEAQQWHDLVELVPPMPAFKHPLWYVAHFDMHRTAKVQAFKSMLLDRVEYWDRARHDMV